ncbi:uncharacterized protein K444DRAFT_607115 [Hyaloscypha bicolor E]|uniref:Uncharacterized protein n=1 Tax=Hyaloscypha bicolor E TaxID=1095630 RepID=A0A2J6TUW0_9HELO|nr:uncharacterized protein K444DRAFT_607115 [Hyaloscypha bicolor E]PMD66824.1 hypothetical protein K444DRAFT_607115 [Hyaloscypha bicolor E]
MALNLRAAPSPTVLGPLTTTFTPPSDCNRVTIATTVYGSPPTNTAFLVGRYYPYFPSVASCLPSGYMNWFDSTISAFRGYYSPGICPSGWFGMLTGDSSLETTMICCPPDYTPTYFTTPGYTTGGLICIWSPQSFPSTIVFFSTNYASGTATTTPAFTTSVTSFPLFEPPLGGTIEVRYKAGDFDVSQSTPSLTSQTIIQSSVSQVQGTGPSLDSSPTSSQSSVSQVASNSSNPGSNLTPTTTAVYPVSSLTSSESAGLSLRTKIGIGVAVPLIAILLVIITLFAWIRRKRAKRDTIVPCMVASDLQEDDYEHKSELPGIPPAIPIIGKVSRKPELDTATTSVGAVPELYNGEIRQAHERPAPAAQSPSLEATLPLVAELETSPNIFTSGPNLPSSTSLKNQPSSRSPAIPNPAQSSPATPLTNPGPLPVGSYLYPLITTAVEEDDLQYQERRLREKRELLAEKERLALEEDRLRDMMAQLRNKTSSGKG